MKEKVNQGDILKIENFNQLAFVASKDFFNQSGAIIGCPIYKNGKDGALHIKIDSKEIIGYVYCEKMAQLDLKTRHYSKVGTASISDIMNITDAIQSIFDYV